MIPGKGGYPPGAKGFAGIAKRMEPGDYIRKTAVSEDSCEAIVVTTGAGRYFRITAESVTFKPRFQARLDRAEVIARALAFPREKRKRKKQ